VRHGRRAHPACHDPNPHRQRGHYDVEAAQRRLEQVKGLGLELAERLATGGAAPADGAPRPFYLPWKADYRGRIYAETPWLTPQGGDLQRALFEFAHGRQLDEAGQSALRRHGANLVSRSEVIKDLGIRAD